MSARPKQSTRLFRAGLYYIWILIWAVIYSYLMHLTFMVPGLCIGLHSPHKRQSSELLAALLYHCVFEALTSSEVGNTGSLTPLMSFSLQSKYVNWAPACRYYNLWVQDSYLHSTAMVLARGQQVLDASNQASTAIDLKCKCIRHATKAAPMQIVHRQVRQAPVMRMLCIPMPATNRTTPLRR